MQGIYCGNQYREKSFIPVAVSYNLRDFSRKMELRNFHLIDAG